jgi:hypothetical protein
LMITIRNIRWTDQYAFGIFASVSLTDRSPAKHSPPTLVTCLHVQAGSPSRAR